MLFCESNKMQTAARFFAAFSLFTWTKTQLPLITVLRSDKNLFKALDPSYVNKFIELKQYWQQGEFLEIKLQRHMITRLFNFM